MIEHPQAPPGCPQFKNSDYPGSHFEIFETGGDGVEQPLAIPVNSPPKWIRPTITAVACFYWTEAITHECETYRANCKKCRGYDDPNWPKTHPDVFRAKALKIIEEWQAWGRRE